MWRGNRIIDTGGVGRAINADSSGGGGGEHIVIAVKRQLSLPVAVIIVVAIRVCTYLCWSPTLLACCGQAIAGDSEWRWC